MAENAGLRLFQWSGLSIVEKRGRAGLVQTVWSMVHGRWPGPKHEIVPWHWGVYATTVIILLIGPNYIVGHVFPGQ